MNLSQECRQECRQESGVESAGTSIEFFCARLWCAKAVAEARLILQGFRLLGVQVGGSRESGVQAGVQAGGGNRESRLQVGSSSNQRRAEVRAVGGR